MYLNCWCVGEEVEVADDEEVDDGMTEAQRAEEEARMYAEARRVLDEQKQAMVQDQVGNSGHQWCYLPHIRR